MMHMHAIYQRQFMRFSHTELVSLVANIVMWLNNHPLYTVLTVSEYQQSELCFHVELEFIDTGEREPGV